MISINGLFHRLQPIACKSSSCSAYPVVGITSFIRILSDYLSTPHVLVYCLHWLSLSHKVYWPVVNYVTHKMTVQFVWYIMITYNLRLYLEVKSKCQTYIACASIRF